MNDDLKARVQKHIIERVEGGSNETVFDFIDQAIEADLITQDEYDSNETAIHAMLDDEVFECTTCNWTFPVDHLSKGDHEEMTCEDCE